MAFYCAETSKEEFPDPSPIRAAECGEVLVLVMFAKQTSSILKDVSGPAAAVEPAVLWTLNAPLV